MKSFKFVISLVWPALIYIVWQITEELPHRSILHQSAISEGKYLMFLDWYMILFFTLTCLDISPFLNVHRSLQSIHGRSCQAGPVSLHRRHCKYLIGEMMRGNTRGSSGPRNRLPEVGIFVSCRKKCVMKSRQRRAYDMCVWLAGWDPGGLTDGPEPFLRSGGE